MKSLLNDKGSTLMVAVFFLAILTVMGTILLTSTAAHLKTHKSQENRKFAFYGAESGIDEVTAVLSKQIQEVHDLAATDANAQLTAELDAQALLYEDYLYSMRALSEGLPNSGALPCPPLYNDLSTVNSGTVNQQAAYEFASDIYLSLYRDGFSNWINENFVMIPSTTAISDLEAAYLARINDETKPDPLSWGSELDKIPDKASVMVGIHKGDGELNFTGSSLVLPVFSIYNTEDSARKLLTVDLTLNVPSYTLPITLDQNVVKYEPNILWTKAITTEKNLVVEHGNVEIFGNVYAYGENIYSYVYGGSARQTKGGVIVGNSGRTASLEVNGEVVTSEDIHFNTNGSSLFINGNAYGNNVVADAGLSGNILRVNNPTSRQSYTSYLLDNYTPRSSTSGEVFFGDVVVRNNLELNGTNARMNIAGNFTGFTGPLTQEPNVLQQTSCIIVDTPDLEDTSPASSLVLGKETVICGIAFLEFENPDSPLEYFTTGESVALRNNYRGYLNWLVNVSSASPKNYFDNFVVNFFNNNLGRAPSATEYNEENLIYRNHSGLFAPFSFTTENDDPLNPGHPENIRLTEIDKADYFFEIAQMEADLGSSLVSHGMTKNIIKDNGVVKLNAETPLESYYGHGVVFANKNILPRRNGGLDGMEARRVNARDMFFTQVNAFGDLLELDPHNETIRQRVFDTTTPQFIFNIASGSSFIYDELVAPGGQDYREIIFVNNDREKAINLGTATTVGEYAFSDPRVNGVIVTRGDVIISGSLDYRGTIIAGGDIIIMDNGVGTSHVTITNDRDFIAKAMTISDKTAENHLSGFLNKPEVLPSYSFRTTLDPDTDKITRDDFTYLYDKEFSLTERYSSIKDMIKLSNWTVVEY